ncbi:MAG: hypothetical protein ABGX16_13775 [Pirellulales bacterium]
MPWSKGIHRENSASWLVDSMELRKLRFKVLLHSTIFVLISGTLIFGSGTILFLDSLQTLKAFWAVQNVVQMPSLTEFAAKRPDLLVGFGELIVFGLFTTLAGVWLLSRTLGPERRPSKSIIGLVILAPLPFVLLGVVAGISTIGYLGTVLASGIMIPGYLWLIPLQLNLLTIGMLSIAAKSARQRLVFVETSSLPEEAVDYFNRVEPDMLEAGLDPIGDINHEFTNNRCRRLWANPNRTFFASAIWSPVDTTVLTTVSVFALTEDGTFLESANVPNHLFTVPNGYEHLVANDGNATPSEVLVKFLQMFHDWIEKSGTRPMQVEEHEHEHLYHYGNAFLTDLRRKVEKKQFVFDFLWLSNEWHGKPLPSLPGRPWQPDEEFIPIG